MPPRLNFERLEPRWMLSGDGMPGLVGPNLAGGSIHGHVYQSAPSDLGRVDASAPLPGVTVQLLTPDGEVIDSVTTTAGGEFVFDGLADGYFGLRQIQPQGFDDGIARAGSGGGSVLDHNHIIDISLAGGAQLAGYTFWETPEPTVPPGEPPPAERPVFPMFVGNVGFLNGPRSLVPVSPRPLISTYAPQRDVNATIADQSFRLLEVVEPTPPLRKSSFEGGCGKLIDDSSGSGLDELPSTDPFDGLWNLARADEESQAEEEIAAEDKPRSDQTHEELLARIAAVEQMAHDLSPGTESTSETLASSEGTNAAP